MNKPKDEIGVCFTIDGSIYKEFKIACLTHDLVVKTEIARLIKEDIERLKKIKEEQS